MPRIPLALPALVLTAALATPALAQDTAAPATTQAAPAPTAQDAIARAQQFAQQARAAYPAGSASIDQALYKSAVNAAEEAVRLAPRDVTALRLRAELYAEVKFWAKAQTSWAALLAVAPDDEAAKKAAADTEYNLGFLAYDRGNLAAAREAFARCLGLAQDARCALWGGRVELEAGTPQAAVPLYETAVRLAPNDKTAAYFLGVARQASQYGPVAVAAFSRAYKAYDAGNKTAALEGFQSAATNAPDFAEAQRFVGRLALDLNRADVARVAWENVVRVEGNSDANKYFLDLAREGEQYGLAAVNAFRAAYAKYTAGDKAAAEAGFQTAATASAKYQKAFAWLGRVKYERGDFAGAVEAYREAVRLDPNDKSAAYFLGLAEKRK